MRNWVFFACLALCACAHAPPPMAWVRTDGQQATSNPALMQQGEIDRTICAGDTQRTNLGSLTPVEVNKWSVGLNANVEAQRSQAQLDSMKGCMAEKGYLLVPADQAEATREQFAAITAQKQAQAAPPPPAQQPRKTAAVKPKMPPVQPASLTTPQN